MKAFFALAVISSLLMIGSRSVHSQTAIENDVVRILTYRPKIGEKYDINKQLVSLKRSAEVRKVLLGMLSKYKYTSPGSSGFSLLLKATIKLGDKKESEAISPLKSLVMDHKVDQSVRAEAVRSLGKIDAAGNKQILFKLLSNEYEYPPIKIYAAEALAKVKDQQTRNEVAKLSRKEQNPLTKLRTQQSIRIKDQKPAKH